jgi:hypothetical protein
VALPVFRSFADYLMQTTHRERWERWKQSAKRANRKRLLSDPVDVRVRPEDVWEVVKAARGRCAHCGSLAVEGRPSYRAGSPAPWEQVGRRIGSLGHRQLRFLGGSNAPANLQWECLWCNTWTARGVLQERGALDRGGFHPKEPKQQKFIALVAEADREVALRARERDLRQYGDDSHPEYAAWRYAWRYELDREERAEWEFAFKAWVEERVPEWEPWHDEPGEGFFTNAEYERRLFRND